MHGCSSINSQFICSLKHTLQVWLYGMAWHIGVPSRYVTRPRPNARHHIFVYRIRTFYNAIQRQTSKILFPYRHHQKQCFTFFFEIGCFFRFFCSRCRSLFVGCTFPTIPATINRMSWMNTRVINAHASERKKIRENGDGEGRGREHNVKSSQNLILKRN